MGDSDISNGIQCIQCKDRMTSNKENLNKPIEETDLRIILHTLKTQFNQKTHISPYFQMMETFWC